MPRPRYPAVPGGSIYVSSIYSLDDQGAQGTLHFAVGLGGPFGVPVPLVIGFHEFATSGVSGSAGASISVLDFTAPNNQGMEFGSAGMNSMTGVLYSNTYGTCGASSCDINPVGDSIIYFDLSASSTQGGAAYVDPLITIDPAWAAANPTLASQVSFSFGPGVVNGYGNFGATAPEPATWAMMLVGLSLVGGGLRTRARRITV